MILRQSSTAESESPKKQSLPLNTCTVLIDNGSRTKFMIPDYLIVHISNLSTFFFSNTYHSKSIAKIRDNIIRLKEKNISQFTKTWQGCQLGVLLYSMSTLSGTIKMRNRNAMQVIFQSGPTAYCNLLKTLQRKLHTVPEVHQPE